MADVARSPLKFGAVVVIGGGCYGSYYVRQLQRAAVAGAVEIDDLVVVDRDPHCAVAEQASAADARLRPRIVVSEWTPYLDGFLSRAAEAPAAVATDAIVPSPLMPHLLYQWVAARVEQASPGRAVRQVPLETGLPVPWQRADERGTHYASFATWMCPINCVEPVRCPHTKGPRDWTMPAALEEFVAGTRRAGRDVAGPYVFHCTHRAYGVGMIDVAPVVEADTDLRARASRGAVDAIVGTVSHCHGAVGRLLVDPP